jgi:hypothetical protein
MADSNSTNAVSFSSACTTNRFPSPRCASAIHIVRPSRSRAETQPKTPTRFLEIVSDYFPVLHANLSQSAKPGFGITNENETMRPGLLMTFDLNDLVIEIWFSRFIRRRTIFDREIRRVAINP